ncbi:MAG: alpha/beta fold hydrolase [Magnetococcales bacterium]|nr:alpha/beta fold hydrolase [Magnetococcales bacterium]
MMSGVVSVVWMVAKVVLGVALLFISLLYFQQERLLFYRRDEDVHQAALLRSRFPGAEVAILTADGVALQGWLVRGESRRESLEHVLIYFGGNAEEASGFLHNMARFQRLGVSVLTVNYRGYGRSGGEPGEQVILSDALSLYDWLVDQSGMDSAKIVAMGRSLGSGVAVHLAAHRPLDGVILVTPYDSMVSVAQRLYPFVPVSLLLRHRFDALSLAPTIQVPMLALMAVEDTLVPADLGQRLAAAWGGEVLAATLPGVGHNDISGGEGYWSRIEAFLREVGAHTKNGDAH